LRWHQLCGSLKIGRELAQNVGVVIDKAEHPVALTTEPAAKMPVRVAMIKDKTAFVSATYVAELWAWSSSLRYSLSFISLIRVLVEFQTIFALRPLLLLRRF